MISLLQSFLPLADVQDTFWFPKSASTFSEEVDSTYDMVLWISLVFFVGIIAAMVVFVVRYRQAKGGKATSRTTHNNVLEISWSVIPSLLLVVMFVRGTWGYLDMAQPPSGSYEVNVTASKWNWAFRYPGGVVHPELHVVKGQPTRLVMQSQDVIHSLFIPAFRAKLDVVPGRYNIMWFEPTEATPEGEYFDLYCAEYCGTDHSQMQTKVIVHETHEELEQWIDEADRIGEDETMEEYGLRLYEQRGCRSCHSLDGSRLTGPSFMGSYGIERELADGGEVEVDENYIRESILEPRAKVARGFDPVMPSFKGQLKDEQIDALIEFIKGLQADN